jgi:hypothetical protein
VPGWVTTASCAFTGAELTRFDGGLGVTLGGH